MRLGLLLLAAVLLASEDDDLRRQLDGIAASSRIVGAAAVVVADGETSLLWTWGMADRSSGRQVDVHTRFRFGSISKHLCGLLAARLAASGRLDLQARVSDLLPDLRLDNPWADRHPLRLIHVLEHTGGLPGSDLAEYATDALDLDPSDYARSRVWRLRWPPGRFYSYANAGHTIAAAAMQRIAGRSFDALICDEVLLPIGMTGASFASEPDPTSSSSYRSDGATVSEWWSLPMRPSGASAGTINDLAALVRMHATGLGQNGERFLERRWLDQVCIGSTAADVRAGFTTGSYGLGGFGFVAADRLWHGHWGKVDGFLASFGVLPGSGSGFALVVNTADGLGRWRLMQAIARRLAGDGLPPMPALVDELDLHPYAGWYRCMTHDMVQRDWIWRLLGTVRIEAAGDRLLVQPAATPWRTGHELVPIDPVQFREPSHWLPRDAFVDIDGERWYIGEQRDAFRPVAAWEAWLWIGLAWATVATCAMLPFCFILAVAGPWRRSAGLLIAALAASAGLCLLAVVAAYVAWGMFDFGGGSRLLGGVTAASLVLCGFSLLAPSAAIAAGTLLIRRWRGLGWWRHLWAISIAIQMVAMAVLAWWGWIPLLSWT